ncbi:MAG: PH domain-containing protein [Candidatus Thorarchaeota archaeon]
MVQDEERIIRPPIEHITSGRVFQPTNAFIGKKMLKAIILMVLIWSGLFVLFLGFENSEIREILLTLSEPLEILIFLGWETMNLIYVIAATIVFVIGSIYATIYVKKIEYSVLGWDRNSMPEIYTKRGIITITKRHVPFRTITHVQTRRGIFDRIMGIGTVQIETAGGAVGAPPSGIIPLIFQRLGAASKSEERVEGIRFHQELRDFILREMRDFGNAPMVYEPIERRKRRKRIFTKQTLEAFQEVRDALKASQETTGGG